MRPALATLVVLGALAGCPGLKHHAIHNAPGVTQIDIPPPRETGDPAMYEPPDDPGEHLLGIAPGLTFMPGTGRVEPAFNQATLELGVQVQLSYGERDRSGGKAAMGFPWDSWGVTVGWAICRLRRARRPRATR